MYSFAQREDVRVVDEPLYGHYLRVSGADHPGRDEVMANMNCDGNAVMLALLDEQTDKPSTRLFQKHMAHHLIDVDLNFLSQTCNVFLIRDPREMLPSLTIQLPHATLADSGLRRQWEIYCDLVASDQQPAILDARELLLDPEGVLRQLCNHIDLPFVSSMLHWSPGPLAEDGVWAPHWYQAVHQSEGFGVYRAKDGFPQELEPLLAECQPWYDKLYAQAIRARTTGG
jgi:hypothetical protein